MDKNVCFIKKTKLKASIAEKIFECKRDGLFIRGTEYHPEGENLPIAIVCLGFMAWQDTVRHYATFFGRNGICSILL